VTAYSIGQRKQPAVSLPPLRIFGEHVAKVILVVATYPPAVRSLSIFKIQHV
jgi:hypothetical protein